MPEEHMQKAHDSNTVALSEYTYFANLNAESKH
jgi:hypothetical protein